MVNHLNIDGNWIEREKILKKCAQNKRNPRLEFGYRNTHAVDIKGWEVK